MECLQVIEEDNLPVGPYYIMPLGPEQNFILGRGTELITEHATLVSREHCIIRYTDEGIGANAVVVKDCPAGSVIAGIPGRVIGSSENLAYVNNTI